MGISIRTRLIAVTVLLAAAGLGAAAFVTYGLVESFLVGQMDTDLKDARVDVFRPTRRPGGGDGGDQQPDFVPVSEGTIAQIRDADGTLITENTFMRTGGPTGALPEDLGVNYAKGEQWLTIGGANGGPDYRAYVAPLAGTRQYMVVARPLTDVRDTLDQLVMIEAGVSGAVLVLMAGMVFVAVRLGLKPLDRVVTTADAISAGDLSLRVPDSSQRTEVGRLGAAFNAMLGGIEDSFRKQEQSEQKLRRFVADASHELRTPLTSLKGYAEMLKRPDLRDDDRGLAVRRIDEASNRMARLVDDMLGLARMDEAPELRLETLDLMELARDAAADARAVEPDRPIEFEGTGEVVVLGDHDLLAQAVANLLANARQHTPPDARVVVRAGVDDGMGFVEVRDHGPGIPHDAQDQLFERFFRLDPSRARARGGAGLGLSIVAATVEAHGGGVSMASEPGDGATFVLRLPLERQGG
ncbi:MAG: HAMP domain-containing sensor histidine kinase [Dehalococcoidia bacterium]|nr:HAMP domain-containing histidine kinase [Dehalococcoidia bacterium]MCB9485127.1 HAMP domain-containing histidine kinase [Thermoflexaceae bacterium]